MNKDISIKELWFNHEFKNAYLQKVYDKVVAKNPNEAEFQQAVYEVLESITPAIEKSCL